MHRLQILLFSDMHYNIFVISLIAQRRFPASMFPMISAIKLQAAIAIRNIKGNCAKPVSDVLSLF